MPTPPPVPVPPGLSQAPSWRLTPRQLCDLELLLDGAFAPLDGFLGRADYESVCASMRLASGALWPIPVTLDVSAEVAGALHAGDALLLRDPEGFPLAVQRVEEVWELDPAATAEQVYGTLDRTHPGVDHLFARKNRWAVGGPTERLAAPRHHDSLDLRLTPAQVRAEIARRGWERAVAFQTRNPLHRAHLELTLRALAGGGGLLLHPVVGMTKPGDVDHFTRVRCYRAVLPHYPPGRVLLALLPLAMRMAGPREALWHALIRRNYGATDFIVGRDHASPGTDRQGRPFYGPFDAQALLERHRDEIGVRILPFPAMVYSERAAAYKSADEIAPGEAVVELSGTELRQRLASGREIPSWFTTPEVERELREAYPPLVRRGLTIFFTGLSGSGKSTLASALLDRLLEIGTRPVTLLDGDLVRQVLSSELGFSREHRDLNIRRIGFVAAEIGKHRGIALCAAIAPYDAARREVRAAVAAAGASFGLVHVATPLATCEQRDAKGLYAKARAGTLPGFTGISDPYEVPEDADLVVDTSELSPAEGCERIVAFLRQAGHLPAEGAGSEARG